MNDAMGKTMDVLVRDGVITKEWATQFASENCFVAITKKSVLNVIRSWLFDKESTNEEYALKLVKVK